MTQKIVIKVQMPCGKCRSRAMEIAVKMDGVSKVEIKGTEKDELVVTGDQVDSVKLTRKLRKKLGIFATISSVEEEKKEEKKEGKKEEILHWYYYNHWRPPTYEVMASEPITPACFIM
ncbi:Heavy metal-associated domain containing protein [Melia azedarach]|uniref:Heavy metal-associated domain containing protein n=1 Tax=Melia azedarach TaxID=155640 RepID=A0ACC1YLW1_MELAZ|nr:Heavy metal-associated domain containing protein [Melia azedarach]